MGLAIGSHGCNIQQARAVDGIIDIQLDEPGNEQPVYFKIYAENPDSARQARVMLEFGEESYAVPRDMVGKLTKSKSIAIKLKSRRICKNRDRF